MIDFLATMEQGADDLWAVVDLLPRTTRAKQAYAQCKAAHPHFTPLGLVVWGQAQGYHVAFVKREGGITHLYRGTQPE